MERILIIEDDNDMREELEVALQSEGYQVSACASGLAAIELAHQHEFDLVVSDVRMAGMDGLDTLARLQEQQPSVATLVITGYTAEADSIRAVKLGVGDFLKKPFVLDEFLEAVARQLTRHKQRMARLAREQSLARVAVWALEGWGANAEGARLGRLTQAAALELGLAGEIGLQAQLAVLTENLIRGAAQRFDLEGLPPDLRGVLQELHSEPVEGEPTGMAARLGRLAFEPEAAESALQAAWSRAQTQTRDLGAPRRRRQLLQEGRVHESESRASAAADCYRELVQSGAGSREALEAQLGLMRLAGSQPQQCREEARKALELATQLNPLLRAHTCLESGIWLTLAGLVAEAVELFREARRLGREFVQPSLEAKAVLALAGAQQEVDDSSLDSALGCLLEVQQRYELVDAAWWMASCLLRLQQRQARPLGDKVLARIGRESPAAFQRLLSGNRLDTGARLLVVSALAGTVHPIALECLRALAADPDSAVREAAQRILASKTPLASPPTLRIYTLGGLQVFRGDEPVADKSFRSLKQRFLLARLACSSRPLSVERLLDELWPDDTEGGRGSLNVSVSTMRKLLRPTNWTKELDYVIREGTGIQLNPSLPIWHDYNELWSVPPPDRADPDEATIQAWKGAVHLYRGPYLEICYLDWAEAQRERTEQFVLAILRRLVQHLGALGRAHETVECANRLLELDNCCQEGHLAMMRASLDLGQPEAALRQFESAKRTLQRELQIEPSLALLEAQQRALLKV